MSFLITLYARKEPTTDSVSIQYGCKHRQDVVFYQDSACTRFYARWSWFLNPPRRNTKTVTLNCWPWAIVWREPVGAVPVPA